MIAFYLLVIVGVAYFVGGMLLGKRFVRDAAERREVDRQHFARTLEVRSTMRERK